MHDTLSTSPATATRGGSPLAPCDTFPRRHLGSSEAEVEALLAAMRSHPLGQNATEIGEVVADHPGMVVLKSLIGGERVVTMLNGEQLPRIC